MLQILDNMLFAIKQHGGCSENEGRLDRSLQAQGRIVLLSNTVALSVLKLMQA
jgi:hypothetical protein